MRKAPAPLFRDPIFDGAADPTIIWNYQEKSWWILYTCRRANINLPGFAFMHGTDIGIAESKDNGLTWIYRGTIPNLEFERGRNTFWAPEVIFHEGIYHMYVSYVPGVPQDWRADRYIIHYTSDNLWDWEFESILNLSSKKVIDACVIQLPDGKWKMWYKDEADHSYIYSAISKDLYNWEVLGAELTDRAQEGPNVFYWHNKFWMITDMWNGLGVYSSDDANNWLKHDEILKQPGERPDDQAVGHHADVLLINDKAYIFYFTHPEVNNNKVDILSSYKYWRTSLQVAELGYENGMLVCDRDKEFNFYLPNL